MNKKTIKSMMIVLMLLAVGLYFVSGTYARYTSEASGTGTVNVAKWAVSIGGVTAEAETRTFTVNFQEKQNDNVVDGFVAPTSEIYADIVINPEGSQVAVDYSLELGELTLPETAPEGAALPAGLAIDRVVIVDGESETKIDKTEEKYSGTIELNNQSTALGAEDAVTLRVYVKWTENANDTAAGIAALQGITMDITATAIQHVD